MRKIISEIRDGSFAKKWIEENEKGCPNFLATRLREQTHPVEQLGPKLRAMMPFLQPVVAPGLATKAAASEKEPAYLFLTFTLTRSARRCHANRFAQFSRRMKQTAAHPHT